MLQCNDCILEKSIFQQLSVLLVDVQRWNNGFKQSICMASVQTGKIHLCYHVLDETGQDFFSVRYIHIKCSVMTSFSCKALRQ